MVRARRSERERERREATTERRRRGVRVSASVFGLSDAVVLTKGLGVH
jgi:hypothetical protein